MSWHFTKLITGTIFLSIVLHSPKALATEALVSLEDRTICIKEECFPIAIGKPSFPTPKGKFELDYSKIFLNGFWWECPRIICSNSKTYSPANNPLGKIWIQVTRNKWGDIGIHETPNKNIILQKQLSHGCIRMYKHDLYTLITLFYKWEVKQIIIF